MRRTTVTTFGLILLLSAGRALAEDSSDSAHSIAVGAAQEAAAHVKLRDPRLPVNDLEWKDLDNACQKGPRDFYGWIFKGPVDAYVASSWKDYGSAAATNPLAFCHDQVAAYRDAIAKADKANKSPSTTDNNPQSPPTTAILYPRFPTNAKEEAEMDAAARKSVYDCYAWIEGPEEAKKSINFPPGTTIKQMLGTEQPDADVDYCKSLASAAKAQAQERSRENKGNFAR